MVWDEALSRARGELGPIFRGGPPDAEEIYLARLNRLHRPICCPWCPSPAGRRTLNAAAVYTTTMATTSMDATTMDARMAATHTAAAAAAHTAAAAAADTTACKVQQHPRAAPNFRSDGTESPVHSLRKFHRFAEGSRFWGRSHKKRLYQRGVTRLVLHTLPSSVHILVFFNVHIVNKLFELLPMCPFKFVYTKCNLKLPQ